MFTEGELFSNSSKLLVKSRHYKSRSRREVISILISLFKSKRETSIALQYQICFNDLFEPSKEACSISERNGKVKTNHKEFDNKVFSHYQK